MMRLQEHSRGEFIKYDNQSVDYKNARSHKNTAKTTSLFKQGGF